jgi:hypothetical protein
MFYFAVIILISYLLLNITLKKYIKSCNNSISTEQKNFSIIIAAKNEENHIIKTINSILNQKYPKDKYEIIIVDDNSTDNTYNLVYEYSKVHNNLKVIKATNKDLPAKKGALTIGIKEAKFENILITDADCIAEDEWISSINKSLTSNVDIVVGIAPFYKSKSIVSRLAQYENLKTFIFSHFAISLNIPFTATARNFCYTKNIYNKINGYKNTLDVISGDDDLLIREAFKINATIKGMYFKNSYVYSYPKNTFKDYLFQKARHTSTSHHYLFKVKLFLSFWYGINFIPFLLLPLCIFNIKYLFPFLTVIICNFLTFLTFHKTLNYGFNLLEIIYLEFLYQVSLVVNYFSSFFIGKKWK